MKSPFDESLTFPSASAITAVLRASKLFKIKADFLVGPVVVVIGTTVVVVDDGQVYSVHGQPFGQPD